MRLVFTNTSFYSGAKEREKVKKNIKKLNGKTKKNNLVVHDIHLGKTKILHKVKQ